MILERYKGVSMDVINFIKRVSEDYKLDDWRVKFWDISGENECIPDFELIYLDRNKDDEEIKKWFLHEVAHSFLENNESNRYHEEEWKNEYLKLCKEYGLVAESKFIEC